MAYMKTGRVHEVRTKTKVILAVVLALLVLIAGGVLFAVKNPRAAARLVLSDADYASYVLLHNVQEKGETYRPYLTRLTGNHAYDSEGAVALELSKDMQDLVGSEDVLAAAGRYMAKLSFAGNTQMQGLHFSNELNINDNRQAIFTHDFAFLDSGAYSSVPQYGYGWTRLFGGENKKTAAQLRRQRVLYSILSSDDETVRKALRHSAKAGYKAVKKDLDVTVDKDMTLDFQDKHATGDRVNIQVDRQDAEIFLNAFFEDFKGRKGLKDAVNEGLDTDDRFGGDASFTEFLDDLQRGLLDGLVDTKVRGMSVDLLVDQKNDIHAFDTLIKRKDGDIIVNAMLDDDAGRGSAFHLRSAGKTLLKWNVEKSSKQSGRVDFALGEFENALTYDQLQTGDGLVFGNFEFAPTKVSWSKDVGTFGLHVTLTPTEVPATADGTSPASFHVLVQTGFSTLGTATVEADVKDAEYTGMLMEDDIVIHPEYKDKEKAARRVQYWLVDLPNADGSYKNALLSIAQIIADELEEEADAAKEAEKTADETLNIGA